MAGQYNRSLAVTLLKSADEYVQSFIEALSARTPENIKNEQGWDFTIGAPLRGFGEGFGRVAATSQDTTEAECKKQARETMFILSGVTTFPASKATGVLSITSTQSITISSGAVVYSNLTGGRVGETIEDVIFTNVETLDVTMIADEAGADIAFPASSLFLTEANQGGTNPLLINNGTDEESDYDRTLRVSDALKAKAHSTAPALINTALAVVLKDGSGNVIESVRSVLLSFPWKHTDPTLLDPDQLGEILMSIQSSLGVPSQALLDEIGLQLTGNDELDGKQGAGQNVVVQPVATEDIQFYVPYKRAVGGVHAVITAEIQSDITTYVDSLEQGEPINPTDWQSSIAGVAGVEYYDEENLAPSTLQTIDEFKIWNITLIDVVEI